MGGQLFQDDAPAELEVSGELCITAPPDTGKTTTLIQLSVVASRASRAECSRQYELWRETVGTGWHRGNTMILKGQMSGIGGGEQP
jgi:hypothetical protein